MVDFRTEFEIKRKLMHMIAGNTGLALALFTSKFYVQAVSAFFLLLSLPISYLMKNYSLKGVFGFILKNFERKKNIRTLPLKSSILFLLGVLISTFIGDINAVIIGLILLTYGDSLASIVGIRYGTIRNPLNPEKNLEGTFTAIIGSTLLISFFTTYKLALIVSTIVMFLESLDLEISGYEVDDNLVIPVSAALIYILLI